MLIRILLRLDKSSFLMKKEMAIPAERAFFMNCCPRELGSLKMPADDVT